MTPMLEKLSKAMGKADPFRFGGFYWTEYVPQVRAVLLAIREADDATIQAMCAAIEDTPLNDDPAVEGQDLWVGPARAAQAAMVDAILETAK